MDDPVNPFRNCENFVKYLLFYYEPGNNVIIQTLLWLYKGVLPIEEQLWSLCSSNALQRKNMINSSEKFHLEEFKNGTCKLSDFDLSFLYKIAQLILELKPRDDEVWTSRCPVCRQDELEHQLFKLKNGRNELAHPSNKVKNITDLDLDQKCEEMKKLLTSILQNAGHKAGIDAQTIQDKVDFVQSDLERISKGGNMDQSMKLHVKNLILNDLQFRFKKSLESSFEDELKGYSVPHLKMKDDQEAVFHLHDILKCNNSQTIVLQGVAGEGKTAVTKYLFNTWLSRIKGTVNGLSQFDAVVRVECRHIDTRDVSEFLEDHLPIASYSFSNTSSLKKQLNDFKVFWILDGFDECTAEFKGFLKSLVKRFSGKHKLLVTTRPNTYDELLPYLKELSFATISLEKLDDCNIEEIMTTRIVNEETRDKFKEKYYSFCDADKDMLRLPLNFTLFVELWKDRPDRETGLFDTYNLLRKVTELQLRRLNERLAERTNFPSSDDLARKINKWFYGAFCKQVLLLIQDAYGVILTEESLDFMKEEAVNDGLIPSYCLSSFLEVANDDDGIVKYDFFHGTQSYVFACLFIINSKKYSFSSWKSILNTFSYSAFLEILEALVCISKECTADENDQLVDTVKEFVSFFKLKNDPFFTNLTDVIHKLFSL